MTPAQGEKKPKLKKWCVHMDQQQVDIYVRFKWLTAAVKLCDTWIIFCPICGKVKP